MKFLDDHGNPVNAVTAEQHALDNPGHHVDVWFEFPEEGAKDRSTKLLHMTCHGDAFAKKKCDWWEQTFVPPTECGHQEHSDGRCSNISCQNYYGRFGDAPKVTERIDLLIFGSEEAADRYYRDMNRAFGTLPPPSEDQ